MPFDFRKYPYGSSSKKYLIFHLHLHVVTTSKNPAAMLEKEKNNKQKAVAWDDAALLEPLKKHKQQAKYLQNKLPAQLC